MKNKNFEFLSVAVDYLKNIDKNIAHLVSDKKEVFDELLNLDMIEHCAEMQANGFKGISKKSAKLLDNKILKKIINEPESYQRFADIYIGMSDDFKIKILTNASTFKIDAFIKHMEEDFKNPKFSRKFMEVMVNESQELMVIFTSGIKVEYAGIGSISNYDINNLYVDSFYKKLNNYFNIIKSMSNKENVDILNKFLLNLKTCKQSQDKFLSSLYKKDYARYYKDNIKLLQQENLDYLIVKSKISVQHYKIDNANDIVRSLKKEKLKLQTTELNNSLTNELPSSAKTLSESIKNKYESLNDDVSSILKLDLDKRLEDTNKIIKKYLSLDPDYRESLKNIEGKSAYDLMMESLSVVDKDFTKLIEEHNQAIVNDMSILNRKNILKKMF